MPTNSSFMRDFIRFIIMICAASLKNRIHLHADTMINTSQNSTPRPPSPPRRDHVAYFHCFLCTNSISSTIIVHLALFVRYVKRDASNSLRPFQVKNEYARFSKYLHDLAGMKTSLFYGGTPIQENINEYARFSKYPPDVKAWIFRGGTPDILRDAAFRGELSSSKTRSSESRPLRPRASSFRTIMMRSPARPSVTVTNDNEALISNNHALAGSNAALTMLVKDNDELHDSVEELHGPWQRRGAADRRRPFRGVLNEKPHHEQVSRMNARLEGANLELKNAVTGYRLENCKLADAFTDLKAVNIALKATTSSSPRNTRRSGFSVHSGFLVDVNAGHMKKHERLFKSINALKAENNDINLENKILSMKTMTLRADVSQFTRVAADLKAESDELVAEQVHLQTHNDQLNKTNVDLKAENADIKLENQNP